MPAVSPTPFYRADRPLRVGFLALTDAAPLVVAQERGCFARRGLSVELCREVGWATIRDKVTYGELDAAHAPAPMLWAAQLGLGCAPADVCTGFVFNLHGNAITLSTRLWAAGVRDLASLRDEALRRRGENKLTFGIVFPYSMHQVLLQQWLRSARLDPERDVRIAVVPPAQMFRNLAAGTLDGYCAGEPWNTLAVQEGEGWCPAWSAALSPGHVEKVLMVRAAFAERRATEHSRLIAALAETAAWCDEPGHRTELAEILSAPAYLDLPVALITNDVDEALLLADRIIPLTPGPSATLGPSLKVSLDRPRDRKALNHDPEFKRLRALITTELLGYGERRKSTVRQKLILPDILPENLDLPRTDRRRPLRPSEFKEEKIEVASIQ